MQTVTKRKKQKKKRKERSITRDKEGPLIIKWSLNLLEKQKYLSKLTEVKGKMTNLSSSWETLTYLFSINEKEQTKKSITTQTISTKQTKTSPNLHIDYVSQTMTSQYRTFQAHRCCLVAKSRSALL